MWVSTTTTAAFVFQHVQEEVIFNRLDAFTQTSFGDMMFVCLAKSQACGHTNDAFAVLDIWWWLTRS